MSLSDSLMPDRSLGQQQDRTASEPAATLTPTERLFARADRAVNGEFEGIFGAGGPAARASLEGAAATEGRAAYTRFRAEPDAFGTVIGNRERADLVGGALEALAHSKAIHAAEQAPGPIAGRPALAQGQPSAALLEVQESRGAPALQSEARSSFGTPVPESAYVLGAAAGALPHQLEGRVGLNGADTRYTDAGFGQWVTTGLAQSQNVSYSPVASAGISGASSTQMDAGASAPIYDRDGNFLGTDDGGLHGKGIVMNRADFRQGMSHDEALRHNLGEQGLRGAGTLDKVTAHMRGLPSRPDWDGDLTLSEANEWYREGGGKPLYVPLSSIDLGAVYSTSERGVGEVRAINLFQTSNTPEDALVYGSITLKRYPDDQVRSYSDTYNFESHNAWNPLNWPRNTQTAIGRAVAGEGTAYDINIYGSVTLPTLFNWTR